MQDNTLLQEILTRAKGIHDYIIQMRRDFHKHPEMGFTEIRTSAVIAEELKKMGLRVQTGIAKTGVIGTLDVDGATTTVAFRADMDALPIKEENDLEYKSQNDGVAHACGQSGPRCASDQSFSIGARRAHPHRGPLRHRHRGHLARRFWAGRDYLPG